jgi:signal transduction histidine kinase
MPDRRFRNRIARRSAVFGPAAIVVFTGFLAFVALSRVRSTRQWVQHTRDVLDASSRVLTALLDAETATRGFVLTHDSTFLDPAREAPERARSGLNALRALTVDNVVQQHRVDSLEATVDRRLFTLDSTARVERAGLTEISTAVVRADRGSARMETIRRLIETIQKSEDSLLIVRRAREARSLEITAGVVILGALIAAGLAFGVNRNFDRALSDRRAALDDVRAANTRLQETAVELEFQAEAAQQAAADAELASERASEARLAAESANRAKAAFLASMSHELRTPLQAALGFAQLVRSGVYGAVNDQQSEVLGRVERSQTHLARLIDDILDFARLEAGRVRIDVKPVRVAEVIGEVAPRVEPQAAAKNVALSLQPPEPNLTVMADRQRLRQILVNLVGNAIKFTPENGTIRIGAARNGTTASVFIRDTGLGIPADHLQSIFEPFVQVEDSLTRTASGAGLGLAISRDLAQAMGGDLTVASELGKGSTFTVVLPLSS